MRTQIGRSAVTLLAAYAAMAAAGFAASLVDWPYWAESLLASSLLILFLYAATSVAFKALLKHGRLNTRPFGSMSYASIGGFVAAAAGWCLAVALALWWLIPNRGSWVPAAATIGVLGLAYILHLAELSSARTIGPDFEGTPPN